MRKKEDYLEKFRDSPLFKFALGNAENEEQAEQIRRMSESFALKVGAAFERINDEIEKDPAFITKLRKALNERTGVVTSRPEGSGSRGD